jgi:hypothetical protein
MYSYVLLVTDSGESHIRAYSEKPLVPSSQISSDAPLLPLGQGEYDEPVGLPLVVVCENARSTSRSILTTD